MTAQASAVNLLGWVVSVVTFLCFFYGPWRSYVTDSTRQRLFEIRDRLFDHATNFGLHQDPAYRATRDMIHSAIRNADNYGAATFLFVAFALRDGRLYATSQMGRAIKSSNLQFQGYLNKAIREVEQQLNLHACRRSLLLLAFTIVASVPLGLFVFLRLLWLGFAPDITKVKAVLRGVARTAIYAGAVQPCLLGVANVFPGEVLQTLHRRAPHEIASSIQRESPKSSKDEKEK